jgi:hypothetical protein
MNSEKFSKFTHVSTHTRQVASKDIQRLAPLPSLLLQLDIEQPPAHRDAFPQTDRVCGCVCDCGDCVCVMSQCELESCIQRMGSCAVDDEVPLCDDHARHHDTHIHTHTHVRWTWR